MRCADAAGLSPLGSGQRTSAVAESVLMLGCRLHGLWAGRIRAWSLMQLQLRPRGANHVRKACSHGRKQRPVVTLFPLRTVWAKDPYRDLPRSLRIAGNLRLAAM